MKLRYLTLFVLSAMLIACDAQTSTEAPTETEMSSSASDDSSADPAPEPSAASSAPPMVSSVASLAASTKQEEMQKDAPAATVGGPAETTTTESNSEEKVTTEATTTPKEAIAPTRPPPKGTSAFPPLVHAIPTEEPKPHVKNGTENVDTTKKPDGNNNGSSPIHSSITLIILGLTGMIFRYQSN